MEAFKKHTGIIATLNRSNVDTDTIIPKQFLKSISRSGYGPNLFLIGATRRTEASTRTSS